MQHAHPHLGMLKLLGGIGRRLAVRIRRLPRCLELLLRLLHLASEGALPLLGRLELPSRLRQ